MSFSVYVRQAAVRDVSEAQIWYEAQQTGLAVQFHAEFSTTIDLLAQTPRIYPMLYRNVRRAVLHRFPYLVWYRVEGSTVTVLACTHGKLDPARVPRRIR